MRFVFAFLLLASSAMAQEDSQETVVASGSRIWPPAGPVTWASPLEPLGPKCAEPTCGGMIDPKEGTSIEMPQKQKDGLNKKSLERLKAAGKIVVDTVKGIQELVSSLKTWFKGTAELRDPKAQMTIHPDGSRTYTASCPSVKIGFGNNNPDNKPCVEIKGGPTIILRSGGQRSVELELLFSVYEACYYEGTCAPKYFQLYAGSYRELALLLNEAAGENVYPLF